MTIKAEQNLTDKIIKKYPVLGNEKYKFNLYSIPPSDYEDYIQHQNNLISEFKTEVLELYKNVEKNEDKFDSLKIGPFKN